MAEVEVESSKLKLMVVDDESDNLDLLYRTFRREFQVFQANSGLHALEVLEQAGEMAVIISDQRMPHMNGIQFLSRTVDRYPDTIRIILTGYTDVEDLVGAINTGKVFKYITKPWNPEELKNTVLQAADTYRVLKQRTNTLSRALRQESLLNAVTTAIRESLDYHSMLQTIVKTIGQAFETSACMLHPVESVDGDPVTEHRLHPESFTYIAEGAGCLTNGASGCVVDPVLLLSAIKSRQIQIDQVHVDKTAQVRLVVPLTYQKESLAVLALCKAGDSPYWSAEDIQLIEGVAKQAALAISQAKLYRRLQEQSEQMRAELAVARQIQTNLLRQSWPELDSVKVQACCYPAREVGGDFFEVFVHPKNEIWLAVGDVSGKGVPAALFMASAISLLRRELSQEHPPSPEIVMRNLNAALLDDLVGTNCFITMVLARYNPSTHELVYANAGHIYPLVWAHQAVMVQVGASQDVSIEPNYLHERGVPLGILPVWQAAAGARTLEPGDVLLLTSDGITEATVASHSQTAATSHAMLQQSGLWRLLIQEGRSLDLDQLLSRIQAHTKVQEDDQTILSLEVL